MGPAFQALADEAEAAQPASREAGQTNNSSMHSFDGFQRQLAVNQNEHREPQGMRSRRGDDVVRLAAARSTNPTDVARFVRLISPTVWRACSLLAGDDKDAREAFTEVMATLRANRFARLGGYTGRGSLETFIALVVRDLLAERMLHLLQSDKERGWSAFQHLFEADIQRLIRRRLPSSSAEYVRRDLYQDVCLGLIEDDYRRLKAYNGCGSFSGFVLKTIDHLLIDKLRNSSPRRRLPLPVARLAPLDQDIFKLVFWQQVPARPEILAGHLMSSDLSEIAAALARVREFAPEEGDRRSAVSTDKLENCANPTELSPEDRLVQAAEDEQLAAALAVLTQAMDTLSGDERVYLTIALSAAQSPPSREIARLMQRPVEDIYKLKQRVLQSLRAAIAENEAIKNWRASV